jgi:nucleotide-binding universal stress UspA family protein
LTRVKPAAAEARNIGVHPTAGSESVKILLPLDGSPYSKRMVAYLAAHDELFGTRHEYVALTVVQAIPEHASRFLDRATVDDYYREQADEVLRPVQAFADQQGWNLRVAYLHGHPAETIATFAGDEKADLIVMGTRGHSALGNVLLGSVASGVIARCSQPVLLIP